MSIRRVCTAVCTHIHPRRVAGSLTVLLLATMLLLASASAAVPEADHVHLELEALRLNVNDYSIKHQVKLVVTVTAEDESRFSGVDLALMDHHQPPGRGSHPEPLQVCLQCKEVQGRQRHPALQGRG